MFGKCISRLMLVCLPKINFPLPDPSRGLRLFSFGPWLKFTYARGWRDILVLVIKLRYR